MPIELYHSDELIQYSLKIFPDGSGELLRKSDYFKGIVKLSPDDPRWDSVLEVFMG